MGEKRKGIILLMRWQKNFESLTDEQAGRMVKAMFKYEKSGCAIYFNDDKLDFFWLDAKDWLDDSRQHWQDVSEKRRLAGIASGESRNNRNEQMLTDVDKVKVKDKVKAKVEVKEKNEKKKNDTPNGLFVTQGRDKLSEVMAVFEKINGKSYDGDREYFKACLNYALPELIIKTLKEFSAKRKGKTFSTEDFDTYFMQQTGICTAYNFLD